MRYAASALLVALASASQPPGGWPGYNNYPPPPQEQPPQQWGGYQQYGEQPQYGAEAVEPASAEATADDVDEAVEADVVAHQSLLTTNHCIALAQAATCDTRRALPC